jgi:diguanylate cyclase (GGDEF)-like protein/PAS domain S-box-containing protein
MNAAPARWRWRHILLANLAVVAAYLGTHAFTDVLALPSGFGTPLFPAVGIGLALTVVAGWRILPGVALGALLFHLPDTWMPLQISAKAAVLATAAATAGATLQAWIGARQLRHWIHPAIDSGHDVLRFLLITPLVCTISATVSVPVLAALGLLTKSGQLATWVSWWAGDSIGVLLAAPLVWIVCGEPRALWRRRKTLVAVPLLLLAGAVVAMYGLAADWERGQQLQAFRLKAQQAGDIMQAEFFEHERFVGTMARALGDANNRLERDRFMVVAGGYVDNRRELRGINWAAYVHGDERAAFEAWVRRQGPPDFTIREPGPDGKLTASKQYADYFPLTYITPPSNSSVLGLDFLRFPSRLRALRQAEASGLAIASEPVQLVTGEGAGVLLFKSIGTSEEPDAQVMLVLDGNEFVRQAMQRADFDQAAVELADVTDPAAPRALTHSGGVTASDEVFRIALKYGGRRYLLRFAPTSPALLQAGGWASWSVLTGGLLMTGLLAALMLLISGERAQIEALVLDRTTRLRDREARLQAILDNAADAIVTVDRDGMLVSANTATAALFGYPPQSLPGLALSALVPPPAHETLVQLLQRLARDPSGERIQTGLHHDGASFPVDVSVSRVLLPHEYLYVCILRDLTEQQRSQADIHRLAHTDALTGLENRFALNLRLEQQLAHARRMHTPLAVLFIDLDHFKKINDSQGHEAGDKLLVCAANRMRELLRDVDTLARLGGDEFIIVLGGPLTPDSVTQVAVRLVQSLSTPYQLGGANVHSGASVGVAMYPEDGDDSATLLRHADTAMYAAKHEGRGNFQFFSESMNAATHEHLMLENRMWAALEHGDFSIYLQPQVDLNSGRVVGAEVLLRWIDPELGAIEPSRFIPIAEECGLILPLGDWVLARTMDLLDDWQQLGNGMGRLRLAVNLSARQFSGGALLARLDQLLDQHHIDPTLMELEITETAAMQDPEHTRQLLRELRTRGFTLAIDDFGTGYSSLAYLKLFAIDRIKIDRGFVQDIETNPNDAVIVAATIALAHSLGLAVVAEGVETDAQWDFLRDKHGDEAQGYLFARPMPQWDFCDLVREQAAVG